MEIQRYIENIPVKKEEFADKTVKSEKVSDAISRAVSRTSISKTDIPNAE